LYTTGSVCKHATYTWGPQTPTHQPRRLHRTQTPRHLPHIIRPRTRKKKPQPHLQRHTQPPKRNQKKRGEAPASPHSKAMTQRRRRCLRSSSTRCSSTPAIPSTTTGNTLTNTTIHSGATVRPCASST